jgi:hypothetical protein
MCFDILWALLVRFSDPNGRFSCYWFSLELEVSRGTIRVQFDRNFSRTKNLIKSLTHSSLPNPIIHHFQFPFSALVNPLWWTFEKWKWKSLLYRKYKKISISDWDWELPLFYTFFDYLHFLDSLDNKTESFSYIAIFIYSYLYVFLLFFAWL